MMLSLLQVRNRMLKEKDKLLTLYISGPMRGYPHHNFPAFHKTEKHWSKNPLIGKIFNPAKQDELSGFDPDIINDSPEHLRECIRRDLQHILECDAMLMLPKWEYSVGARLEHALAVYLNLSIFYES